MAAFLDCIIEAHDAGELDADVSRKAQDSYRRVYDAASTTLGPVEADRLAASAVMDTLERQAIEAKRNRALSIRTRRTLLEGVAELKRRRGYQNVDDLGGGGGGGDGGEWSQGGEPPKRGPGREGAWFARALELIVENKPGQSGGPFSSIEDRYRAVRGMADASMAALIEKFETRLGFDTPGRAHLANVVREAFGQDTGDKAAKALAEAWSGTAERLRLMFNAAGGSIGKLDGWGLPQAHDTYAVREAGKDAWIAAVMPRLDLGRIVDGDTGQPLTGAALVKALGETWESIVTLGANRRAPGESLGAGSLSGRRADGRFLIFKSADDWLAYSKDFGEGDPFSAMMGHIDELARDIAQMQILGPNPSAQFAWLKDAAMREALLEEGAGVRGAADRAKGHVQTATDMLDFFTGTASTPVSSKLAGWGATSRSVLTAVQLGSAILSDIPSAPYFGAMARSYAGLSKRGNTGRFLELLANPDARRYARRSGFVIEQAADGFLRATHDNLRLLTVGERVDGGLNALGRRLPVFILRAQGLTGYNAARKRSFRFEFMGALHDRRSQTIADLKAGDGEDRGFASWLEARGFSETDWAAIRAAPVWEPSAGAQFLRPTDVPDETLALRLAGAIDMETRFAAPETTLWTRAKLLGRDRPGTVSGEARRSWAMFRSFSLTATHLYAEEAALRGKGNGLTTSLVIAQHMVFLTLAGAANIQLREITKGNDPLPMDNSEFWAKAILYGGGLGILGDMVASADSRYGQTQAAAWGPMVEMGADLYNASVGNVLEIGSGMLAGQSFGDAAEDARAGRDVSKLVRDYSPASTLWWTRAIWNRGVADNVQRILDPEADEYFERRVRQAERHRGATSWWEEGEAMPERAPDLSALLRAGEDSAASR